MSYNPSSSVLHPMSVAVPVCHCPWSVVHLSPLLKAVLCFGATKRAGWSTVEKPIIEGKRLRSRATLPRLLGRGTPVGQTCFERRGK